MVKEVRKSTRKTITVRCYAELNDFLPSDRKQKNFELSLKMPVTAAEVIEFLGIPLSEVDLIMVNSWPAAKSHRISEHDYVSVYPVFETLDISSLKNAPNEPLRITRFILDAHLGKLARYLRMLGFDTLYRNDYGDHEIIDIAGKEKRIILSRDKLLLKSPEVHHGYYVRAIDKHNQLVEIVEKFDLCSQFKSFTRCMTCNSVLRPIKKEAVRDRIKSGIFNCYNEFFYCPVCDKVFWKGSHFQRMERLIINIIKSRMGARAS